MYFEGFGLTWNVDWYWRLYSSTKNASNTDSVNWNYFSKYVFYNFFLSWCVSRLRIYWVIKKILASFFNIFRHFLNVDVKTQIFKSSIGYQSVKTV